MGYFSEMSLDMQEGRKPFAATPTRECAFEDGESFDELPVPPADRQSTPPALGQAGAAGFSSIRPVLQNTRSLPEVSAF